MQSKQAENLRRKWDNKPCKHPQITKMYNLGSHDGYVCCQCGEEHFQKEDFFPCPKFLNKTIINF